MRITDEKKEEIRDAADLVEVVGDYVRLKRSGSGFMGLCPFHEEKTPSFSVTPRLGIYKCFGCGESGDIFRFVMEMEGVGFQEAMRTLAERYGVSLPVQEDPEQSEHQKEREGIFHALRFAGLYYFRQLREEEEAEKARAYLKNRGMSPEMIKEFGIGYAPAGGEALLREASREGIETRYLEEADLIKPSKRGDGHYDTFRDRLMFPIFSPSGKVIAFAGRLLGDQKTAKYINSAQTPVYNKSEVVYGIHRAKNEIRKQEEVILVEGYTDVITLAQAGIGNVVASSGTALTAGQIRVLKRYGSKLIMIYDADSAGQKAMERGLEVALVEGMEVEMLELPGDEDPDSFVRQFGKESFEELKQKQAADFVTFRIRKAEKEGEMESPSGRTRLIERLLENIAAIPDALARQVFVQHLHQKTQRYRNGSDRELFEELDRILKRREADQKRRKRREERTAERSRPPTPNSSPFREGPPPDAPPHAPRMEAPSSAPPPAERSRPHYERELLRLMLRFGSDMVDYVGRLCNENLFEDDQLREFYLDIIERHQQGESISPEHYLHREHPYPALTGDLLLERYTTSDRHHERTGKKFERDGDKWKSIKSTIKPLRMNYLQRLMAQFAEEAREATMDRKRELVALQKKTQHEITRMQRHSAEELFPDPPGRSSGGSSEPFSYTMKSERKE
ncbi:MAG: DNA primase [Bacteroidota bacterium]